MKVFSAELREKNLNRFKNENFDLVIIGGGINGAGVARDAVLRGMKVALVEAGDFAVGASSKSSKLIHGGIRYLENLEFHLVFEALRERARLFEMAPHLVHPLRFMIPLYAGGRVGVFKMGLGMWLYDALAAFEVPEMHERLSVAESHERQPLLRERDLLGSYVYSDAYMDDDRLVIETLRSANSGDFAAANYVKATGAQFGNSGQIIAVDCEDQEGKSRFQLRGRHFISTTGPWTDEVGRSFFKNWQSRLRPTKGVHLTFQKNRLPLSSAVVMAAESRIVFGIPRHEMVIIGTTDTDFQGDPSQVTTEPEDVRYLMSVLDNYFPQAKLKIEDIVGSYAGVRPLVKDEHASEGKTSREHSIWRDPCGLSFVAGGKYTTYRLISEQAVAHCLEAFPVGERVRFVRSRQSCSPLNPLVTSESMQPQNSLELQRKLCSKTKLTPLQAQWLVERHGPEALEIVKTYGMDRTYWQLEALHAIDAAMCLHLVDFYARRVPLILAFVDHGMSVLPEVLKVFVERLNWDSHKISSEKQRLEQHLKKEFAWRGRNMS